jgi:hypothetical protein
MNQWHWPTLAAAGFQPALAGAEALKCTEKAAQKRRLQAKLPAHKTGRISAALH